MIIQCKMTGKNKELPCSASNCPLFCDCLVEFQKACEKKQTHGDLVRAMSDEESQKPEEQKKLMLLIRNAKAAMKAENLSCDLARNMFIADFLLANGVTVREWIPVSQPPKEDERVLVWLGNNRYNTVQKDTDRIHNGRWVRWGDCVTHWMPLNVPEPMKEGKENG